MLISRLLTAVSLALFATTASFAQTLPTPGGNPGLAPATGTAPMPGGQATGTPPPPPLTTTATPPPPPPPQNALRLFVAVNGQTTGPFNEAQLGQMIAQGQFNGSTMVWQDGMVNWAPASTVASLAPLLKSAMDPATFMTGVWQIQNAKVPMGAQMAYVDANLSYRPDGKFDVQAQIKTMGGAGQMPDFIDLKASGTYTVTQQGQNQITVSTNGTVTMTSTTNGNTQTVPSTETDVYTIVDRNTLRDEMGNEMKRMQ